jgi:hypothetical protein
VDVQQVPEPGVLLAIERPAGAGSKDGTSVPGVGMRVHGSGGSVLRQASHEGVPGTGHGTVEELRQALLAFRETYNTTWLIERHGFVSPAECRRRQLQPINKAA